MLDYTIENYFVVALSLAKFPSYARIAAQRNKGELLKAPQVDWH